MAEQTTTSPQANPELPPRTVNVYLTREQTVYLATDPSASPGDIPGSPHDLVIELVDDRGGLFVHNAALLDDEGSGVWVDAAGNEHYGPGGKFAALNDEQRPRIDRTVDVPGLLLALDQVKAITDDLVCEAQEDDDAETEAAMQEADDAVATVQAFIKAHADHIGGMELRNDG